MLTVIYGASGNGKTQKIRNMILSDIQNETRCFLIVPDQEVYHGEQTLLPSLPENAGRYLFLTGFTQLFDLVTRETGGRISGDSDDATRMLLMWKTLHTLSGSLGVYGTQMHADSGLGQLMLSASDELHANGITPQDLDRVSEQLDKETPLRNKLQDLSLICATYDGFLADALGGNRADRLFRLAEALEKVPYFSGSHVYLDSFTDFTEGQYAVLRQIARQAALTVTLCADGPDDRSISTGTVYETGKRLEELGKRYADGYETVALKDTVRPMAEEIRILRDSIWDFSYKVPKSDGKSTKPVRAVECVIPDHPYAEAEYVAKRILALHRDGVAYGEIAVVFRDAKAAEGCIDSVLQKHGIPCFLSEKSELISSSLSRFVLSSLRAVTRGYRQEDVFSILKTGLCNVDEREADVFEDYCRVWNFSGSVFTEPVWNRNPDGYTTTLTERGASILQTANQVREQLIAPLVTLSVKLNSARTASELCGSIYSYLVEVGVPARLLATAGTELSLGQTRAASETMRRFDAFTSALCLLSDVLSTESMSKEELISVLEQLLSYSEIASVPDIHDCVVIGSADTLRVDGIRAVFLLGVTEGDFPAVPSEHGILNDAEKQLLKDTYRLKFGKNSAELSEDELYYVKRAMCKASEHLIISAPTRTASGKKAIPSIAYNRVRKLFPGAEEYHYSLPIPAAHPVAERVNISKETVKRILGDKIYLTKSSLEKFLGCPYSYWCTYALKLREEKPAEVSADKAGTFIHFILEHYLRSCIGEDGTMVFPETETELVTLTAKLVGQYLSELFPDGYGSTREQISHTFRRLQNTAVILLKNVTEEFRTSSFLPAFFELKISDDAGHPHPLELTISEGENKGKKVNIGGTVDRVDMYRDGNTVYLRIVDYKTGTKTFDINKVEEGKDLQLLLYLFALTSGDTAWLGMGTENIEVLPAATQYLYADYNDTVVPTRSGLLVFDKELLQKINTNPDFLGIKTEKNGEIKPSKSLISREDLSALEKTVETLILETADRIYSGHADKTPSEDACKYCPIRSQCSSAAPVKEY